MTELGSDQVPVLGSSLKVDQKWLLVGLCLGFAGICWLLTVENRRLRFELEELAELDVPQPATTAGRPCGCHDPDPSSLDREEVSDHEPAHVDRGGFTAESGVDAVSD